jgi:hypothetical protein
MLHAKKRIPGTASELKTRKAKITINQCNVATMDSSTRASALECCAVGVYGIYICVHTHEFTPRRAASAAVVRGEEKKLLAARGPSFSSIEKEN